MTWRSLPGFLVVAASACAVPRIGGHEVSTGNDAADGRFAQANQKWAQEKQIYDAFDVKMFFGVTDESWEFRQSRIERLALLRQSTPEETNGQLAVEKADHDKYQEFTFAVHPNERQFDDFDRGDSIWRTALITPKGEALPLKWERISRPDVNTRALYPYVGDFWVLYKLRFNRVVPPETPVTLRFASSVGHIDFSFPAE